MASPKSPSGPGAPRSAQGEKIMPDWKQMAGIGAGVKGPPDLTQYEDGSSRPRPNTEATGTAIHHFVHLVPEELTRLGLGSLIKGGGLTATQLGRSPDQAGSRGSSLPGGKQAGPQGEFVGAGKRGPGLPKDPGPIKMTKPVAKPLAKRAVEPALDAAREQARQKIGATKPTAAKPAPKAKAK